MTNNWPYFTKGYFTLIEWQFYKLKKKIKEFWLVFWFLVNMFTMTLSRFDAPTIEVIAEFKFMIVVICELVIFNALNLSRNINPNCWITGNVHSCKERKHRVLVWLSIMIMVLSWFDRKDDWKCIHQYVSNKYKFGTAFTWS
jgi:hypothetical protein